MLHVGVLLGGDDADYLAGRNYHGTPDVPAPDDDAVLGDLGGTQEGVFLGLDYDDPALGQQLAHASRMTLGPRGSKSAPMAVCATLTDMANRLSAFLSLPILIASCSALSAVQDDRAVSICDHVEGSLADLNEVMDRVKESDFPSPAEGASALREVSVQIDAQRGDTHDYEDLDSAIGGLHRAVEDFANNVEAQDASGVKNHLEELDSGVQDVKDACAHYEPQGD